MFSRLNRKMLANLKGYQLAVKVLNTTAEKDSEFLRKYFGAEGIEVVWYDDVSDNLAEIGLVKLLKVYKQLLTPQELQNFDWQVFRQIIIGPQDKLDLANNLLTINANASPEEIVTSVKRYYLEIRKKNSMDWENPVKQELKSLRGKKIIFAKAPDYDLKTYITLKKINMALSGLTNTKLLPKISLVNFNLYENKSIYYLEKEKTLQIRYLTEESILERFFLDFINKSLKSKK